MKTASELRAELANVFVQLKVGEISPQEAAELANLAGKMIASAKVRCHRMTEKRISEIRAGKRQPHDVEVVDL